MAKPKKTNKKKKKQPARQRVVRPAMPLVARSSLPRPRFSVSSKGSEMHVSGHEVAMTLKTESSASTFQVDINPSVGSLFPRLAGFAAVFERYRFKRLRLNYHPGCPATRSGALGLYVRANASNQTIPSSIPQLAGFDCSAVGAVGQPMSTPWFTLRDPQWYYVQKEDQAQDDDAKSPGSIGWYVADATSADDGTLAGYVSIEYEVEFQHYVSVPQSSITWASTATVGTAVPSSVTTAVVGGTLIEKAVGYFDMITGTILDVAAAASSIYATYNRFSRACIAGNWKASDTLRITQGELKTSDSDDDTVTVNSAAVAVKLVNKAFLTKDMLADFIPYSPEKTTSVKRRSDRGTMGIEVVGECPHYCCQVFIETGDGDKGDLFPQLVRLMSPTVDPILTIAGVCDDLDGSTSALTMYTEAVSIPQLGDPMEISISNVYALVKAARCGLRISTDLANAAFFIDGGQAVTQQLTRTGYG